MKINTSPNKQLSPKMQELDNKLKGAAELYEKQFLRQMVKAMRDSVSHSAMTKPGMAENIYREQLDEHYVDGWVEKGGTGFADMVYNELVTKYFPQLGDNKPKHVRPVNLSDRYQGVSRSLTNPESKKHTFNINIGEQKNNSNYLKIPWKAKFEKEFQLSNGEKVAEFSHDNGLKSTFVFKGELKAGLLNKTLEQGENFALLGPESQSLTWQIQDVDSRKDSLGKENKSFD
jgi:peptidoglycan hydrolase FlgJ